MIDSLEINGFRGFEGLHVSPLGQFNIIVGPSGSGKTNLLEAVFLYCSTGDPNLLTTVLALRRIDQPSGLSTRDWVNMFSWFWPGSNIGKTCSIRGTWQGRKRAIKITCEEHLQRLPVPKTATVAKHESESKDIEKTLATYRLETKTNGRTYKGNLSILVTGIKGEPDGAPNLHGRFISLFDQGSSKPMAKIWSKIDEAGESARVLELLRSLEPCIEDVRFHVDEQNQASLRIIHSKLGRMPLEFQGSGFGKALSLACSAVDARNGILIIDEFESSLHVRIQDRLAAFLLDTASTFNAQVFLSTHSLETLDTFLKAFKNRANLFEGEDALRVLRLKRKQDSFEVMNLSASEAVSMREDIGFDLRRA